MIENEVERIGGTRTKIVATVGPKSRSPEMLRRLIDAGVDVFRLNFSHGTHEEHSETFGAIRAAAADRDRFVAILQDLCGPKIRLGPIAGDVVECAIGDRFVLCRAPDGTDPHMLGCTHPEILDDLGPGDSVLFADGLVGMEVLETGVDRAELVVSLPGRLRSRQGINLPGVELKIPALTLKDREDLAWTAAHDVDFVGLSFVRSPDDVVSLRRELDARGVKARIVSKIEKPQAVAKIDDILQVTDAIMIARGDLGVEMDVARVPRIQKQIIKECHRYRIPVITATQMLTSMESSNRPTRAEASDVYNAVLDGTDAVMLSGETAIGDYPIEAVRMMSRIVSGAEASLGDGRSDPGSLPRSGWITETTAVMVEAAGLVCRQLRANLMVVATRSGRTALALSKQMHPTPILALTDDARVARAMALFWGVTPVIFADLAKPRAVIDFAIAWARERGLLASGDRVVIQVGTVPGNPVHNAVVVEQVG